MGTRLASEIITLARRTLMDVSNVSQSWTDDALLAGINAGQEVTVTLKPDAYATVAQMQLTAGAKQEIPADGIAFIRATHNLGDAGLTPGEVIREVSLDEMDLALPSWHVEPGTKIRHVMRDPRLNKVFYVWPQRATYIELAYSVLPPAIATVNDPIVLDDVYATALHAYCVYHALSENSVNNQNRTIATEWFQRFGQLLGGKVAAELSTDGG